MHFLPYTFGVRASLSFPLRPKLRSIQFNGTLALPINLRACTEMHFFHWRKSQMKLYLYTHTQRLIFCGISIALLLLLSSFCWHCFETAIECQKLCRQLDTGGEHYIAVYLRPTENLFWIKRNKFNIFNLDIFLFLCCASVRLLLVLPSNFEQLIVMMLLEVGGVLFCYLLLS